jgi:hypothetical protein
VFEALKLFQLQPTYHKLENTFFRGFQNLLTASLGYFGKLDSCQSRKGRGKKEVLATAGLYNHSIRKDLQNRTKGLQSAKIPGNIEGASNRKRRGWPFQRFLLPALAAQRFL